MTVEEAMKLAQGMTKPAPTQVLTNVVTGAGVSMDYAALGVETGFDAPPPEKLCFLFLSMSGAGKTTLLSYIPNSLMLTFDKDGARSIPSPKAHRVLVNAWDKAPGTFAGVPCVGYRQIVDKLLADAAGGKPRYQTISIDTADEWFPVVAEHVIHKWNERADKKVDSIGDVGREGKGFGEVAYVMENEILRLRGAGYGVMMSVHLAEKQITVGDEKRTVIRPVLSPKCYQALVRRASYMGQLVTWAQVMGVRKVDIPAVGNQPARVEELSYVLPVDQQKTEYRLLLKSLEQGSERKKRLPHMPDYITLPRREGWQAIVEVYKRAVDETAKEQ